MRPSTSSTVHSAVPFKSATAHPTTRAPSPLQSTMPSSFAPSAKQSEMAPTTIIGTTLLENNLNNVYEGSITINGKLYSGIVFDTGSSTVIVPASCCVHCRKKTLFNITYDDGTFFRYYYCPASVSLGGYSILNYPVGVCINTTKGSSCSTDNGVFGMAWPIVDFNHTIPFVTALYRDGVIPANMFSIYLSSIADDDEISVSDDSSELMFGGMDPGRYTGSVSWITLVFQDFWTIKFSSLSVEGIPTPVYSSTSEFAAVDSGTSGITAPPLAFNAIISGIRRTGVKLSYEQM